METFDLFPPGPSSDPTCSAEGSRARTFRSRVVVAVSKASAADYGQSSPELLASYDRATSSWRTSQLCLDGELSEFLETWPRSGMTVNGTAYRLPPLVPLTDEIGSGLWPTPHANCSTGSGRQGRDGGDNLQTAVAARMWPTPTSRDWKDGSAQACANVPTNGLLGRAVHWPTPGAEDAKYRYSNRETAERRAQSGKQIGLECAAHLTLQSSGALNPTFVEWLMGYPRDWTEV
jgi:DNA (cytosine-5)-methyltransferase 1